MSAVKDLTPLGIKEVDLNLLRNDRIKFDCGPLVYRSIIDWGFSLPKNKQIKEHINDLEIEEKIRIKCKVDLKKWMKRNETKIAMNSFSDFDITALHDFLPILCYEKIVQTGGQEHKEKIKDPNSVESLLKEIKAFRNEVSHEYAKAVKVSHIDEMKDKMRKCIRAAGKLYGKDQTEIEDKVKDLDDEFEKILLDTTNLYENRVKYIAQKISSEVPSSMLERYSPYFSVPLPGSYKKIDTSEIFQCSKLSVITEDKESTTKNNKTVFPCTEIYNYSLNKFVVINGGPGSGKTTLMRNMYKDMLETTVHGSAPRYEKNEKFNIPIYLECRNEQQTNLSKFLREYLKDFLSPEDDIYEAFKIVKYLVFLIDGYDEINNNCRQLVDSIIDFCRDHNACCIISSRVDAGNNFIGELQDRNLNCIKVFIEAISEMSDKVNFLKNYAEKMDDSIDTDKLVNSFKNLTAAAREVFSSPILLALFISLFVHDPDSVSQMKNEQSAYEAVRTNILREMSRKLRNTTDSKGIAEDVVKLLCHFCLKLFRAKKYFLEGKDYSDLVAECKKIRGMPEYVDIHSLLSCILMPEHSFKFTLYTSYQFMHSTIQEFLAAKYVSENIRKRLDDRRSHRLLHSRSLSDMKNAIVRNFQKTARVLQDDRSSQSQSEDKQLPKLLQDLELAESQRDIEDEMKRYGNIVKLLILETLGNGLLPKYSNTFTLLLKKYYKPWNSSPDYHLDLILSSGKSADIISIVSDCMKGWYKYNLEYSRHIKPMTEVVQTMEIGVKISFNSSDVVNTQHLIKLLTILGDSSEIELNLRHSHDNYHLQEGEFYTQLKNSKCKVTYFRACIASGEHLSIVVQVFRGYYLAISTPSVTDISFAALEEHKGNFSLSVKYTKDYSITGSNPVKGGTELWIDDIPADGKEYLYRTIKYICPKSKVFSNISLRHCHITDTDADEVLKKLHEEKIRTTEGWGGKTEVEEWGVYEDQSRILELHLTESEPEARMNKMMEESEEGMREEEKRDEEKREEKREEEKREEVTSGEKEREEEKREEEKRVEEKREEEKREDVKSGEGEREEEENELGKKEEEKREVKKKEVEKKEDQKREEVKREEVTSGEEEREEVKMEEEKKEEEKREVETKEEVKREEVKREEVTSGEKERKEVKREEEKKEEEKREVETKEEVKREEQKKEEQKREKQKREEGAGAIQSCSTPEGLRWSAAGRGNMTLTGALCREREEEVSEEERKVPKSKRKKLRRFFNSIFKKLRSTK